jgi:transposase-like protein
MKPIESRGAAAGDVTAPPSQCPACRSSDVRTTSKVVTAEAYWRCEACGEVWNDGRRRAADRYTVGRPWGR